jgi:hypothetical protein
LVERHGVGVVWLSRVPPESSGRLASLRLRLYDSPTFREAVQQGTPSLFTDPGEADEALFEALIDRPALAAVAPVIITAQLTELLYVDRGLEVLPATVESDLARITRAMADAYRRLELNGPLS